MHGHAWPPSLAWSAAAAQALAHVQGCFRHGVQSTGHRAGRLWLGQSPSTEVWRCPGLRCPHRHPHLPPTPLVGPGRRRGEGLGEEGQRPCSRCPAALRLPRPEPTWSCRGRKHSKHRTQNRKHLRKPRSHSTGRRGRRDPARAHGTFVAGGSTGPGRGLTLRRDGHSSLDTGSPAGSGQPGAPVEAGVRSVVSPKWASEARAQSQPARVRPQGVPLGRAPSALEMTNMVSAKNEPDKAASSLGRGRGFGTKKAASTEPVCSRDSARHLLSVERWGRERASSGGREAARGALPGGGAHLCQAGAGCCRERGTWGRAGGHSACVPGCRPQGPCGGKRGLAAGRKALSRCVSRVGGAGPGSLFSSPCPCGEGERARGLQGARGWRGVAWRGGARGGSGGSPGVQAAVRGVGREAPVRSSARCRWSRGEAGSWRGTWLSCWMCTGETRTWVRGLLGVALGRRWDAPARSVAWTKDQLGWGESA